LQADELKRIVASLVNGTTEGDVIDLDAIGEAIGTRLVTQTEIDMILTAIESTGRRVESKNPPVKPGEGEATLKKVLTAARSLRSNLGRPARVDELAEATGLSVEAVKHALELAKIIQR